MYDLTKLKAMVSNSDSMTAEARELSERDRDYYDSHQLTAEELQVLAKRKQPAVINNRIRRKIDAMIGIEQRGRVDPRAYPREPGDEDAADLATKALVFVEESERIDVKRSAAFENLLIEGYGGAEVCVEQRGQQLEIAIKRIRWEEIFFDPHSREKDFSDASYVGVLKWMSLDAARDYARQYYQGDDIDDIVSADTDGTIGTTFEDRPADQSFAWADKGQKRVRLAQMYYKSRGQWHLAIFTGKGELFNDVSPYVGVDGAPGCPIILMSGYVDRENRRSGIVRDMISPQDEINKRRSKLLHQLNSRQTVGIKGAVDSVASMKRELAAPDGHIAINVEAFEDAARVGMKPFDVIQNQDQTAGQFSLLQESKLEIDLLGPNDALLGEGGTSQSGRAQMIQQQAGLAELAPIYDSLRDWTERLYRQVWAAIKQFWDGPRWIRVTENEEAPQFIGINQVMMGPMGPQMVNQVAQIDVDITIETAPEYASLRAEQFEKLAKLAESGFPIPPQLIIEASDLRDKKKLLAMMNPGQDDPQAQQKAAVQEQLAQRGAVAEVAAIEAKGKRDEAAAMKDIASIPLARAEVQAQVMKQRVEAQRMALGY